MKLSDYHYDAYTTIIFKRLKEYAKMSKDTYAVNLYKVVKKRLARPKKRNEIYRMKTSKRKANDFAKEMLSVLIIKGIVSTFTDCDNDTIEIVW